MSPAPTTTSETTATQPVLLYPATRRADTADTLFGRVVADPFRWLEDPSQPEVATWTRAQDELARKWLGAATKREVFATRLTELFYYDAISAPLHRKGRYFYSRKHASKEKNVVYWREGENGQENVLLDPNVWSSDGSVGLRDWSVSLDGRYVAYQVTANNSDESVTHVLEVKTGKKLRDVLAGTKYADIDWTPDNKGFYYTWVPPVGGAVTIADRPGFAELRYHRLGDDPAKDPVIRAAIGNPQTFLGGYGSRDGKWIISTVSHGWTRTDVEFRPRSGGAWTKLTRDLDANYTVYPWRDAFYVLTNEDAPRYRVFRVDPRKPERTAWREIVPESADTLEGMNIVGEHLVLNYLHKASSQLRVHKLDGTLVRTVPLPGVGTSGGMTGNPDEDTGYFGFSSFTEPTVIFKTSIKAATTSEWARVKLPVELSSFVTEQVTYPSKDGTGITMFLIRHKDAKRDGNNKVILYGYGGFAVSLTPAYSSTRAAWLEQGGMYAIPNLRGGGEYGEAWHKAGMQASKQNVFDDYLAAARYLIAEKWTTPQRLGIQGGSNGGLLVGAAMTQAPDLFGAVVCSVPLLDMVRYHLFGSGKTWIPEYGSAEAQAEFETLLAYSPYHRVKDGTRYPPLLMDAADSDDRVDPMHARKFVAAIQSATAGRSLALLRVEAQAGHGGADMVKAQVQRNADVLAFFWSQLGGTDTSAP